MMAGTKDLEKDPMMNALKNKRTAITIMIGPEGEMSEESLDESMEEMKEKGSDLAPESPSLKTADEDEMSEGGLKIAMDSDEMSEEDDIPELPGKLGAKAMEMMRAKKKMKG